MLPETSPGDFTRQAFRKDRRWSSHGGNSPRSSENGGNSTNRRTITLPAGYQSQYTILDHRHRSNKECEANPAAVGRNETDGGYIPGFELVRAEIHHYNSEMNYYGFPSDIVELSEEINLDGKNLFRSDYTSVSSGAISSPII